MKNYLPKHAIGISALIFLALFLASFTHPTGEPAKEKTEESMPIYGNWKTYSTKDGLPSDKVYAVRVDEDRLWVGTSKGLALLEEGEWTVYTEEDGLAHRGVLAIDISPVTGDVWIATMSGLTDFPEENLKPIHSSIVAWPMTSSIQ